MATDIHVRQTLRGYDFGTFKDSNGQECSVQCSSSIGDGPRLWLGCDHDAGKHHVTQEELSPRMHLNERQVRHLVLLMTRWLETGRLEGGE